MMSKSAQVNYFKAYKPIQQLNAIGNDLDNGDLMIRKNQSTRLKKKNKREDGLEYNS